MVASSSRLNADIVVGGTHPVHLADRPEGTEKKVGKKCGGEIKKKVGK